jgi:hypothetical protein
VQLWKSSGVHLKQPALNSSTKTAVAPECASASGSGQNSRSKKTGRRQSASARRASRRAELSDGETSMTAANDLAVRRALELAGVEFIDENGGGPGVRLRKPQRSKQSK